MRSLRCLCGADVEGGDEARLFVALRAHVDQAHPQWGIPDWALRQVLARRAEMAPLDGRPVALPGEPVIHPLGPERLGDFPWFFDSQGFRDDPFGASCDCMEAHVAGSPEEWMRRTADENRGDKSALIRSGAAEAYPLRKTLRAEGAP
jgi:hypothetical protein